MPAAPDGCGFALRIERSMAGLGLLGGWVDTVATSLRLNKDAEFALRLCAEEAATNIVKHGTPVSTAAESVVLRVAPADDSLQLSVEDHCAAFDPLQVPAPTLPAGIADARVGGFGIHLMRQYARTIAYERLGDMNRLTLCLSR